jgi:hypothetical protein
MSEQRADEQRRSDVVCARGVSMMAQKHSSVGGAPEMKPVRVVSGVSSVVCRFAKACMTARSRAARAFVASVCADAEETSWMRGRVSDARTRGEDGAYVSKLVADARERYAGGEMDGDLCASIRR